VRLGQWLRLLALVISLYILWQIRQVVLLVLQLCFGNVLNQVVRLLQRYRIKRVLPLPSQLLCYWLVIGFFAVIGAALSAVAAIVQYLAASLNTMRAWFDWLL